MQRWRYLKPLDSMERITQQDLCNKLDHYFTRIDAEDIGFVILDDAGNEQFVLCPAAWMEYQFDKDFGCMIISALRYAIRRSTYMPNIITNFIRRYIPILDTNTLKTAIEDIENELAWGGVSDPALWRKLKDDLAARQAFLLEADTVSYPSKE